MQLAWFALLAIVSVAPSQAKWPAVVWIKVEAIGNFHLASIPNTIGA
jgi:hypothetical protein